MIFKMKFAFNHDFINFKHHKKVHEINTVTSLSICTAYFKHWYKQQHQIFVLNFKSVTLY